MASTTLPVHPLQFSTPHSEDSIEFARRRAKWPASIREDQSAIEQARQELGPDADAKEIIHRAQQIKAEVSRGR